MAISKREIAQQQAERFAQTLCDIENKIDSWLCSRVNSEQKFEFAARTLPNDLLEEIERRYRAVGWIVERIVDKHNGMSWTFK